MGAVPEVRQPSSCLRRQARPMRSSRSRTSVVLAYGYRPIARVGRRVGGAPRIPAGALTSDLVIGIVSLAIALRQPDGTLTVTYSLQAGRAASPQYRRHAAAPR